MSDISVPLTIPPELHAQFLAEAEAVHRPAVDVLNELVEAFVTRQRDAREHDAWFRAAVEEGVRSADDPNVARISNDEVWADWKVRRAELLRRAEAE